MHTVEELQTKTYLGAIPRDKQAWSHPEKAVDKSSKRWFSARN